MTGRRRLPCLRRAGLALLVGSVLLALARPALAHGGALRDASRDTLAVPTWLFLSTGGGVVGASFLLASFVTDRGFVRSVHRWGGLLPGPGRFVRLAARVLAVAVLAVVLVVGFVGPDTAYRNLAVLIVWVAWWGGYVASTYLLGNTWPTLNPWRAVADLLPSLDYDYPERWGAWPSVAALLALIWVEVTAPVADDPGLLASVVAGYTLLTLAGTVAVGTDVWFERVDPIARVFRYYGRAAPLRRTDDGVRFRLPGMALSEPQLVTDRSEVAFVVALLWVTTYDGFVGTPLWAGGADGEGIAAAAVGVGVPAVLAYLALFLLGYAVFLLAYLGAAELARRFGDTFLTREYLARRFAPSLLAIAAGYHLAHNFATVLTLAPTLLAVGAAPLSPPQNPPQLAPGVLGGWSGGLELAAVLVGHLVAVWVAHATAFDAFPSRMQAIRSQYGVTLVMVLYTMTSLWIVSQPYAQPPFLEGLYSL